MKNRLLTLFLVPVISVLFTYTAQADPTDLSVIFEYDHGYTDGSVLDVKVSVELPASVEGLTFGFNPVVTGSSIVFSDYIIGSAFTDDDGSLHGGWNVDNLVAGFSFPSISSGVLHLATLQFNVVSLDSSLLSVAGLFDKPTSTGLFGFLSGTNLDRDYNLVGSININPVPEPATMLLLGTGLAGMGLIRRRKK